jgi:chemotaxis protein MotB
MPKRKKGGHDAGLELESGGMMRWLLTYADLITLLLAMFVILYAMASSKSSVVLQEIMAQFRAVFGPIPGNTQILPNQSSNPGAHYKIIPGEPEEGGPSGIQLPKPVEGTGGDKIKGELKSALQTQLGANKVAIRKEARGLVISLLTDKVLFDLGDTHIKPEMKQVLDEIARILQKHPDKKIAVEGHTDDLSIKTSKFPSNWDLSTGRATAVVKYFVEEKGLDPSRFSAAGYAEYQPLVPNISEANRRINRRVDIVIMKVD